jgi:hypothetical protein
LRDDPLTLCLYPSWGELSSVAAMNGVDGTDREREARLQYLRLEHRDLDAAIDALRATAAPDQLQLARLKKRKLRLRDEIALIEDQMIPDIIA